MTSDEGQVRPDRLRQQAQEARHRSSGRQPLQRLDVVIDQVGGQPCLDLGLQERRLGQQPFGLVLLLSGAASAAVVLAARGALDTHRFTIEVMHGIGATDLQVTRLFQRKIAIDALIGSIIGAVAAALVLLLLSAGASFAGELTGGATLGAVDLIALAFLPLALTALATWVARTAVLAALRQSL